MNNNWFRRRWMDGRTGTTTYMIFAFTFVNFILITYRFLIEEDPLFEEIVFDLWLFGLIFLITYIPVSIVIGFWHRKTQMSVEMTIKYLEYPFFMKMFRVWLDVETGNENKEELEKIKGMLQKIEGKK